MKQTMCMEAIKKTSMETKETGKDSPKVQVEIIREVQVDLEVIVNLNDEMVEMDLGQNLEISSSGCEHRT